LRAVGLVEIVCFEIHWGYKNESEGIKSSGPVKLVL